MATNKPLAFNDDSILYFDVWKRPVFFAGNLCSESTKYYEDRSHKHIVRLVNKEPTSLGIVGTGYHVVHNKEICESIEDTFMETLTDEQLEGVIRRDSTSYNGGTCVREYIFKNITADIGSGRSTVGFRVIVVNGYDGSSSFKFYHGAIDFFCTNGMVTGSYNMTVKRHTSGFSIPNLTNKLTESISTFYKEAEQWRHWVGKDISDEDAEICYKAMPSASKSTINKLMNQFRIECDSHGRTMWALYSAATYYASHNEGLFTIKETGNDNVASTLLGRGKQVKGWIATEEFNQLAA